MTRALWLAAFAIAAIAGIRPAVARTVSYAIVIGNNAPPGDDARLRPLRYADDDAVRYYQLFSALGEATLLSVLDATTQRRYPTLARRAEPPTLTSLRAVVARYAAAMSADRQRGDQPVLYFAFNGHGARDATGGAFLALLDGPLTQSVLYDDVLARLPAVYSHVLIDACHAGGVVGVRGDFFGDETSAHTKPVTPDELRPVVEAQRFARLPHVGVIIATTLGEEAHEWSEIEAGVFSHEVLSGLVGPADVNGDGEIEYTELQAFVAAANHSVKDPRAIVQVIARPPRVNHNAALISLARLGGRTLTGALGALGHFHIELDSGQRYLDAHLAGGASGTVVLPDGGAYVRTETHEAHVPAGERVALDDLRWSIRSTAARGSIEGAYRSALFAAAYGRDYYRGYVDSIGVLGVTFAAPPDLARADEAALARADHRPLAIAMVSVASASLATSAVAAVLAVGARREFNATTLQRRAERAKQRYDRDRTVAIAAGAVAVGTGVAAYWLWPRATAHVAPVIAGRGSYGIALETRW